MANKVNMTIRMDPEIKAKAAALFKELGMDLSTATAIFYRQAIRVNGIPFEIKADEPNEETLAAMEEIRQMKENPDSVKGYTDVDEMMRELLA